MFSPGDGPARVTAVQSLGTCQITYTAVVTPVAPLKPRIALDTKTSPGYAYTYLRLKTIGGKCELAKLGAVTFRLTGGGESRTWTLRDVCGRWASSPRSGKNLAFQMSDYEDDDFSADAPNPAVLLIKPKSLRTNMRRTYRITASQDGQRLRTVRFRLVWRYTRGYKVWQDTDDFVNYCINNTRTIYSQNGRLYCEYPPSQSGSLRLLH